MAVKRNKAAKEFETMLRQFLLRGGGSGPSCARFEPETASAYLEDALNTAARLRYEDHLAGCAACRRGVIELRRLMPEVELAPIPLARPNRFSEWWETLRQGVVAAPWRWGMAAGALALLLAFIIIPRQQDSLPAGQIAEDRSASAPAVSTAREAEPLAEQAEKQVRTGNISTPTPVPSPPLRMIAGARRAAAPAVTPRPLPPAAAIEMRADLVGPNQNVIAGRISDQVGAAVVEAQVALVDAGAQQPRAVTQTDASGQFSFNEVPQGTYNLSVQARGFQSLQISNVQPQAGQQVAARLSVGSESETVTVAAAAPAPPPPASVEKSQEKQEEKDAKAASEVAASSAGERARNQPPRDSGSAGFVPRERARRAQTRTAEKPASPDDDETVRAMTRKVRDKTFRFENGRWVDIEFKPEYLPQRTRVARNSADYERLLAEQPDLKPFFDLGRVIVVWKGKVYEVR